MKHGYIQKAFAIRYFVNIPKSTINHMENVIVYHYFVAYFRTFGKLGTLVEFSINMINPEKKIIIYSFNSKTYHK